MAKSTRKTSQNPPATGEGVRRLIVELKATPQSRGEALSMEAGMTDSIAGLLQRAGAEPVADFDPVLLPSVSAQDPMASDFDNSRRFEASFAPEDRTLVTVAHGDEKVAEKLMAEPRVVGVYADIPIEPCIICPGSGPQGNTADIARLLCTPRLHSNGMDGSGVLLAIVDTGINRAHLASRGLTPSMDSGRSWVPGAGMTPFDAPVGHGTMCAYDALIAAPRARLLDIQLLRSTVGGGFGGFLSDAVRAYAHLQTIMMAPTRPGEARSLVVNNSWGMFHPSWDFPVGNPGNYSDNPNHPFNRSVAALEALGADILFAAGNCGANCPDGRCQGVTANAIYGANGHSAVLCVAGVDTGKVRVGYSSQGPGRLSRNKPDICGFTHFSGSGVYAADGGTSAACPVVAGLVAAIRSRKPHQPGNPAVSPHAIRELVRSTAEDLGSAGFDFDHGFGVVNGCGIVDRVVPPVIKPIINICDRFPDLCKPRPVPIDFCRRYPQLCKLQLPPVPIPFPRPGFEAEQAAADTPDLEALLARMWELGYADAKAEGHTPAGPPAKPGGCNCSG